MNRDRVSRSAPIRAGRQRLVARSPVARRDPLPQEKTSIVKITVDLPEREAEFLAQMVVV